MTPGSKEWRVRRLKPQHHAEWLIPFLLDPLNHPVGYHVFHVPLVGLRRINMAVPALLHHRPEVIRRGSRIAQVIAPVALLQSADVSLAKQHYVISRLA